MKYYNKYASTLMNSCQEHQTVKESENHTFQERREKGKGDSFKVISLVVSSTCLESSHVQRPAEPPGRTPSACSAPSLPPS